MAATVGVQTTLSTPTNRVNRDNITLLIRNNTMNDSVEFESETEMMETDSPVRKPSNLQPISKKLFHSPLSGGSRTRAEEEYRDDVTVTCTRRRRKRKQSLVPTSAEKIKRVYVTECEKDGYSSEICGGMRKKVLISLFHNKEYSIDVA